MTPLVFHPAAKAEFREAAEFYESRQTGLARDFRVDVERALKSVQSRPENWPFYKATRARHCLVRRFPYVVFYVVLADSIWVVGISHAKRRPGYWLDRIS